MKLTWQRGWGGSSRALPFLVFLLAISTTVCAFIWADIIVGSKDQERFTYATEEAEQAIQGRLEDQVDLLRSTAATFTLEKNWTHAQFEQYVQNLDLSNHYKGTQGIGYAQAVDRSQIGALEKRIRAEGIPEFTVHPRPTSNPLFPIVYLEPESRCNVAAIGFDGLSDPVRKEAMEQARDEGQPVMTRPEIVPAGNRRQQTGIVIYYPIYQDGDQPATPEDRRKELIGFLFSSIRTNTFYQNVLEGEARRFLNVQISDDLKGGKSQRLYSSFPPGRRHDPLIHSEGPLPVLGRTWLVRYESSVVFEQESAAWLVQWIAIAGGIVSLLLSAVSFSQVRANRQLARQANVLSRRESNQRLLATVGARLFDASGADHDFHEVGKLVVKEFADWFAVVLRERFGVHGSLVSELKGSLTLSHDPGSVLEVGAFQTWLFDLRSTTTADLEDNSIPGFAALRESGLRWVAVVPLANRLGRFGTVLVGRLDGAFDEDDLNVVEQIGLRTALAVDSARLFDERESELDERRKAESQVRQLNENLENLVQERTTELRASNQELEAFCYSVSHDLRAPLRSVDGFSKSLLEDYGERLDEQGRDYLARVRNASHRMDQLITSLLNLSRITRLEIVRQPINISAMAMEAALDAMEGQAAHINLMIQPRLFAEGDPKLVRVIFDNLIGNAVKFGAKATSPTIEIGYSDRAFFVRDNGVGFNPAYAEKLFVAFERLHTQTEFPGTGIGLATVQRIVHKHGGTVWAQSEPGKGATFFFTLR